MPELLPRLQGKSAQARQRLCSVQSEMASIVAAAVHQGLVSVYECVCDSLDGEAFGSPPAQHGQAWSPGQGCQWGRLIAEHYTDPQMPGQNQDLKGYLSGLSCRRMLRLCLQCFE